MPRQSGASRRSRGGCRSIAKESEDALIEKVLALNVVAIAYLRRGGIDRATPLLVIAEEAIKRVTYANHVKAGCLCEIGNLWEEIGDRVRSLGLCVEACAVAKESISIYRKGGQRDVDSYTVLKMIIVRMAKAGELVTARAVAESVDNAFPLDLLGIVGEIEQGV